MIPAGWGAGGAGKYKQKQNKSRESSYQIYQGTKIPLVRS